MNALLPPLVAAFLAEWGDKTQILAAMLAIRFSDRRAVFMGVAAAALLNSLLAAFAGSLLVGLLPFRSLALLAAIALVLAGVESLISDKWPRLTTQGKGSAALTSFFAFGIVEFGDKSQFLTFTLAACANSLWLTGLAATAGILLANAPAILLAGRFSMALPLPTIRRVTGSALLIAGLFTAIAALDLL